MDVEEAFTTDPRATPLHVAAWGFLGDTWPFFRPNFSAMEAYREEQGVDEVASNPEHCMPVAPLRRPSHPKSHVLQL